MCMLGRPITILKHLFKACQRVVGQRIGAVIDLNRELSLGSGSAKGVIFHGQFAFQKDMSSADCAGVVRAVAEDQQERRRRILDDAYWQARAVQSGKANLRQSKPTTAEKRAFRLAHAPGQTTDCGGCTYTDLASYYDAIDPIDIEIACRSRNMPEELIRFILEGGYMAASGMFSNGRLTEPVDINGSIRQGDPLSPYISLFVLDPLLRELSLKPYVMLNGTVVGGAVAYADDTVVLAKSREEMEEKMGLVGAWTRLNRISLNSLKCDAICHQIQWDGCKAGHIKKVQRVAPPPLEFQAFDQLSAVPDAHSLPGSGIGAITTMAIKGTPLDKPIRHLGVYYTPELDSACHGEQVTQRLGMLAVEVRKRQFTMQQIRHVINTILVPVGTYAVVEACMSNEVAHKTSMMLKNMMMAATKQSKGTAYSYIFAPIKDGGAGVNSVQMERLAAISSELKLSLNGNSFKCRVYKDRWLQAIRSAPDSPVIECQGAPPNFVRQAIQDLSGYGGMIRYRAHETVARTLDNVIPAAVNWRDATRKWYNTPLGGGHFNGELFSDVTTTMTQHLFLWWNYVAYFKIVGVQLCTHLYAYVVVHHCPRMPECPWTGRPAWLRPGFY